MGLYVCTHKPILISKKLEELSLEITQTGELVIFNWLFFFLWLNFPAISSVQDKKEML
tara:strand:- start:550 stop:723 length:174 start_codon:yes stop_codon:yes gene_type:complete